MRATYMRVYTVPTWHRYSCKQIDLLRYCVNCVLSVGQCRDLFFSCWSSLVLSRLDYGNLALVSLSSHLLSRLQSVMNAAARLIFPY